MKGPGRDTAVGGAGGDEPRGPAVVGVDHRRPEPPDGARTAIQPDVSASERTSTGTS